MASDSKPVIVIDGLTFQLQANYQGGISRIWKNIISLLMQKMPECKFLLLERDGCSPQISGLDIVSIPRYSYASFRIMERDAKQVSDICHNQGAQIFMSTYYSLAPGIFSVQMVYDMIPEVFKANQETGMWLSKHQAFCAADSFIAISKWTRQDLRRFYPKVLEDDVTIAYPGISPELRPATPQELSDFRTAYGIDKPYFLMVGSRRGYKNGAAAIKAFSQLPVASSMKLVLVGGEVPDAGEQNTAGASLMHLGQVSDEVLRAAFSGAHALVYPSVYEGFGMPVTEALACNCPVITCSTSSIPEASGGFCLYARPDSVTEFQQAMAAMLDPAARKKTIDPGMQYAHQFTWDAMAESVKSHLEKLLAGKAQKRSPAVVRRMQALEMDKQAGESAGDSSAEIKKYSEIKKVDPGFYLPHFRLAKAYEKTGDLETARIAGEKAISLDTYNKPALLFYHQILTKLDKAEKSLQLLNAYDDRYPADREILLAIKTAEEAQCKKILATSQVSDAGYIKKPYRVSVLVSTYNSEEFMNECLNDLQAESIAPDIEIIVIDAHSPRNEGAIVRKFQEKFTNIRYIRTIDRISVYQAWNVAIYLSTGTYITPFSTNDRLDKEAYEFLSKYLDDNPDISLVYGDSYLTDLPHQPIGAHVPSKIGAAQCWPDFNYQTLLVNCAIGPHPLWRRSVHEDMGYFDARYLAVGDQDFWLRMGRKCNLAHIKRFTGLIFLKPDSLSLKPNALRETVDIHIKHLEYYLFEKKAEMTGQILHILLNQFLEIIIRLVEAGENRSAAEVYDNHRKLFPTNPELAQIDSLIAKMKSRLK